MTCGIGILGAGAIARVHAQGIADAGGQLVGFCDPDEAKAVDAAAAFGAKSWTGSDEMFSCDEVTAVVVAVPNALHAPLAIAALDAGRHVLLEKPMAMNVAECAEIIAARDRAQRVLQVGFVCRFAATVLARPSAYRSRSPWQGLSRPCRHAAKAGDPRSRSMVYQSRAKRWGRHDRSWAASGGFGPASLRSSSGTACVGIDEQFVWQASARLSVYRDVVWASEPRGSF